jgi:hypothetical protein
MRRIAVLVMSISLMVTAIAGPSQAVAAKTKVTKPSAPTIVSVTSTKPKKGKVNITVKIGLPASNGGSKITGSKVTFAGKSCTMKNTKTTCTIKGISEGTRLKIVAISKNKKGFGKKSKVTKHTAGAAQLRFNIKNATGLALSNSSRTMNGARFATSSGSNLLATNAAGQVSNAVSSGSAPISKFLIAPNGNLFVLFREATDVNGVQCLLAQVIKESGAPICVDSTLARIDFGLFRVKPIQFDSNGAIYYSGTTADGKSVLRKYQSGQTVDLISDYLELERFAVVPSGDVIISGITTSTNVSWTRRINVNGSLQALLNSTAMSIDIYSDGNMYLSTWSQGEKGILKFNVATNGLEANQWIGGSMSMRPSTNDVTAMCAENSSNGRSNYSEFCGWYGTIARSTHNTVGGKTFILAGSGGEGLLTQVYPSVNFPSTSVKRISHATTLGDGIVLTGSDASNQNITTYFNADSGRETVLIPSSSEIEVFHMAYNAATNKLMFDGLRFADNKYVFGQVDLGTNQLNIFSTLTSKWDDFQGFQ